MIPMGESGLSELFLEDVQARLIEPDIYSVLSDEEVSNAYDSLFGNIYDRVACNPAYNRLLWGYSVARFSTLAHEALRTSREGSVLDLGCGSLAFTAREYVQYRDRPVVLLDQSLKMLQIARSRVMKLAGKVPDNMLFLRADALHLPFREKSFTTIISQNLLHCIGDTERLFTGLRGVAAAGGKMYFTTLVRGNRLADGYLRALANGGKLISRSMEDHLETFRGLGMAVRYDITGNMAVIYCDL